MVLRFLGEATTDANGLAVLSDGYTGTGAGEIDVVAKTEIDDRIFQSEPYTILDTKWYDLGTDSTNSMLGTSSSMTVTYGDEYCTLSETTSGTAGVVVTNTSHYIQPNDVFEFDFLQVDGQRNFSTIYVRNKANGTTLASMPHLYDMSKQLDTWIHLKCQIIDNKLTVYVDDNTTPIERTLSNTDTDYRLYFNTVPTRDIHTIKFKNFKVYSG